MKIAIVGAGPAGCHLAHLLADTEHEILLFDHRVPYEKPCGGGLSPLVGRRFPGVMAIPFARHRPPRIVFQSHEGSQVERALDSTNWAIVSRAEFGQALLDRALANGRVRFVRERVVDFQGGEGHWRVRTASGQEFPTSFLVGADGVRSIVREQVMGPIPRQHLYLTVGYLVRCASDAIVFQTYKDLEGYLWSFPRADHSSVGIGSRLGALPPQALWRRVDRFLGETCPGAKKEKRWTGLLPMAQDASLWDTPCAGPGWALLGDAAGHVHPLTGEGIAYALWSAHSMAEALLCRDTMVYDDLWREHYGRALKAASEVLCRAGVAKGAYEALFLLTMILALPSTT